MVTICLRAAPSLPARPAAAPSLTWKFPTGACSCAPRASSDSQEPRVARSATGALTAFPLHPARTQLSGLPATTAPRGCKRTLSPKIRGSHKLPLPLPCWRQKALSSPPGLMEDHSLSQTLLSLGEPSRAGRCQGWATWRRFPSRRQVWGPRM